jgi:hypothetical protein
MPASESSRATAVITSVIWSHIRPIHSESSSTWSTRWNSVSRSAGSSAPAIARTRGTIASGSPRVWSSICGAKPLPGAAGR